MPKWIHKNSDDARSDDDRHSDEPIASGSSRRLELDVSCEGRDYVVGFDFAGDLSRSSIRQVVPPQAAAYYCGKASRSGKNDQGGSRFGTSMPLADAPLARQIRTTAAAAAAAEALPVDGEAAAHPLKLQPSGRLAVVQPSLLAADAGALAKAAVTVEAVGALFRSFVRSIIRSFVRSVVPLVRAHRRLTS
jgi:hypothetical protein